MKKKRMITLLLAAAMTLTLFSCGESSSSQGEGESSSQAAQSEKGTDGGVTTVSNQTITRVTNIPGEPNYDIDDGADISEQTTTATTTAMTTTATEATTSDSTTKTTTTTKATTKAKPVTTAAAKTQKKIIPATQLARMTTAQLKAVIGNNYRAGKEGDHFGVTSDCFPHVFLAYNGINNAAGIKKAFDAGHNYVNILVLPGGLIGDNAYVGDTYKSLLTKIECLCNMYVSRNYNESASIVDGCPVTLRFDNQSAIEKAHSAGYIDPNKVSCKCINASITAAQFYPEKKYNFTSGTKATIAANTAPLYFACDESSPVMWTLKKGETVYVGGSLHSAGGPLWYPVYCYTTSNGKIKRGYVSGRYLKT